MVGIDELRARRWAKTWRNLCMSEVGILGKTTRSIGDMIDKYEVEDNEDKEASDGENDEEA